MMSRFLNRIKQLTLRGFDEALLHRLQEVAKEERLSLNKAALLLLRKGAGVEKNSQPANVVGDSLDHLIGSWSAQKEKEFLAAIGAFEQIDEGLWS